MRNANADRLIRSAMFYVAVLLALATIALATVSVMQRTDGVTINPAPGHNHHGSVAEIGQNNCYLQPFNGVPDRKLVACKNSGDWNFWCEGYNRETNSYPAAVDKTDNGDCVSYYTDFNMEKHRGLQNNAVTGWNLHT